MAKSSSPNIQAKCNKVLSICCTAASPHQLKAAACQTNAALKLLQRLGGRRVTSKTLTLRCVFGASKCRMAEPACVPPSFFCGFKGRPTFGSCVGGWDPLQTHPHVHLGLFPRKPGASAACLACLKLGRGQGQRSRWAVPGKGPVGLGVPRF